MSEMPSLNTEAPKVSDSEASEARWIDPMFAEKAETRLSDEPEPSPEDIAAQQAEEAAAAEQERKARGEYNAEEIEAVVKQFPDEDEPEDKPAEKPKAEEAEDEDDGEDDEGKDEGKAGEDKKPRRRSRARRERRALERKVRELEQRLSSLGTPSEKSEEPKAEEAEEVPLPTLEDHDFDQQAWATAYGAAVEKRAEAKAKAALEAPKKAEEAKAAEEAHAERMSTFREREEDARDKYDDYDDKVYDLSIFIPDAAADLIMESETGPEIAYYLATHQDEAVAMKDLDAVQVARAVGRIEARLTPAEGTETKPAGQAEGAEEAKPIADSQPEAKPRRTPTKAPDPVPTLGGGGSAGSSRDPSKLSMDEYREARLSGKLR